MAAILVICGHIIPNHVYCPSLLLVSQSFVFPMNGHCFNQCGLHCQQPISILLSHPCVQRHPSDSFLSSWCHTLPSHFLSFASSCSVSAFCLLSLGNLSTFQEFWTSPLHHAPDLSAWDNRCHNYPLKLSVFLRSTDKGTVSDWVVTCDKLASMFVQHCTKHQNASNICKLFKWVLHGSEWYQCKGLLGKPSFSSKFETFLVIGLTKIESF